MFEKDINFLKTLERIGGVKAEKEAKKIRSKLLKEALTDLYENCTYGLSFLSDDKEHNKKERDTVKTQIQSALLSSASINSLSTILFTNKDPKGYEKYLAVCRENTHRFYYDNYFKKRIIVNGKKALYSSVFDMSWDKGSECWSREENGRIKVNLLMPYSD